MFDFDWKNMTDFDTTNQLNEYGIKIVNHIYVTNYASYVSEEWFEMMFLEEK